jgi:ribonuclease HI
LERSLTGRGSSSNQEIIEKVWKKLWKIQCPEKMKIVLWRIAQNCLPTGDQLQTRSIPTRYDCVFCNRSENVAHCFLLCHYVKEIWAELKIYFDFSLNLSNFVHIQQWLLDWILNASDYQSVVFAVAAWHIWENRNNTRNGSEMVHPSRIVGKIKAYIDFIFQYNFKPTTSIRRENQKLIPKWSPPPEGMVMINVDAAIFSQTSRMGISVVIRNSLGRVLAATRCFVDKVNNPELGEAIAMRHALKFAEELGYQKIIVASDCSNLIAKVNSKVSDRSNIGAIIYDIKSRAPKFVSCSFVHISRLCNEAAHVLAKSAESDKGSCWFNIIPEIIRTIVCNEQFMN